MTASTRTPEPADDVLADTAASAALVRTPAADDRLGRRLDQVRLVIAVMLGLLGVTALVLLADGGPGIAEVAVLLLTALLAAALLVHHRVADAIAVRRATREASMTRILQGLSRSLSPDSVVEAIVQELTNASGADHVVVARVRQPDQVVEVTLSAARASVPASRTYLRPDVPGLSIDRQPEEIPGAAGAVAMAAATSARLEADAALEARYRLEDAQDAAAGVPGRDGTSAAVATAAPPAGRKPVSDRDRAGGYVTIEVGSDVVPVGASRAAAGERATRGRRPALGALASGARAITSQVPGRRAQLASQAAADEIARKVRSAYGLPYTLAAPLVAEGRFLGALILSKRTRESWADGDRRLLTWASREVAAAFARAYALEEAERGAHTDALTGLPNRRSFDDLIAIVPHRRRAFDDLGILMIDIDRFKSLNDRHGHATGDTVLRAVAAAIAATVRAEDTPARYGGEEFAVILRRASAPQAAEVAERVRRAVATIPPERLGVDLPVTVSVGVAVADQEEAVAGVIERADQALYAAKHRGRNRVEVG